MLREGIMSILRKGKDQLRLIVYAGEIRRSGLFDKSYYSGQRRDSAKKRMPPVRHYLLYGANEGLNPSESFDTLFYLQAYPGVAACGMNPLLHYIRFGKAEGNKTYKPNSHPLTRRNAATLIFDHNYGGGTWTYVYNKLINASTLPQDAITILARYDLLSKAHLIEVRKGSDIVETASYKTEERFFQEISKSEYAEIIVNNLVYWPSTAKVLDWVTAYKRSCPTVCVQFKGHDYYSICPGYTLLDEGRRFCGIREDEEGCNACVQNPCGRPVLLDNDNKKVYSVTKWRAMWARFFADTLDVLEVFSESSRKIFAQAYPAVASKIKVIPHEIPSFECHNIAIVGHLSLQKGAEVVRKFCRYADDNHITDIQLYLFGWNAENVKSPHLTEMGEYERHNLPERLKKARIELVFIPSVCPETFCYTAGEAISLGYPVACFDLGGQADQVRHSERGVILYDDSPAYLYKTFKAICSTMRENGADAAKTENATPAKTIVMQDTASRDFLKWMYEQRDDKSHFVPEADDAIRRTDKMPQVIAAYLPQFHDFPENIRWFGKGFSEWTNTSQTLPQFLGHRQPHTPIDVGFYNLNTAQIMHRQAELAKKYGITGFCVYYYWFSGKKLMDQPLKHILADKTLDFPFFLFWANDDWTMCWGNGATREVLYKGGIQAEDADGFMRDALPYMKDSRYIRIQNKPVLLIYKINLSLRDEYIRFVKRIQEIAVENGFDGLYLVSPIEDFMDHEDLEGVQEKYKLDALIEFHPIAGREGWLFKHEEFFDPACRSVCYDVDDFVQNKKYLLDTKAKVFPGLFPDWDNSPRRYNRGAWILQNSPDNYKQWLVDLIRWTEEHNAPDERFIFVNAWNEWAEGAHLEPDTYYGYAYLQKTRDALEESFPQKED